MNKNYKIGDTVKVRMDLSEYKKYPDFGINKSMLQYKGMRGEVIKVESCYYKIDLDGATWSWCDTMLESVSESYKIF